MDGDETKPPPPGAGTTIRIDGEGRWFFDDRRIDHAAVLDLLRCSLRSDGRGGWEVHSAFETRPVLVEDTPLFVVSILETEKGRYALVLDDSTDEPLDPATLRKDEKGFLALVREGRFPARFNRAAYIALGHLLEERADGRWVLPVTGAGDVDVGPEGPADR
ncbi:MAG: hypothetical protein ACYS47_11460 [Planctomycetota bacterium]